MKMRVPLFATVLLFAMAASSVATAAAGTAERSGRSSDAACQAAFQQSEAAMSGCRLLGIKFHQPNHCSLGASCPRSDGTTQVSRMQTQLQNLPKLRNCDGTLDFLCD